MKDGQPSGPVSRKPLRHLATIRSSNVDKMMEAGEETVRICNYVDVYYNRRIDGNLDFATGSATHHEIRKFGLRAGDVIITKDSETPDDIAVPALVESSAQGVVCGYHLAVLRPNESVFGPYLFWSLMAKPTREEFGIAAQGVTRFGLTLGGIGSVTIPVADISAQKAIAGFLDREIALIDQLIAKKERQITLLGLRARQSVSEMVIGQVSERGRGVATGLDYIPKIPANWTLKRAGHLFQQVAEPNIDDLPVLSVSIHSGISDRQLDDEERDRKVNLIEDRSSYKRVRPGYLAYNMMRAWQGAVGVSIVEGAVSPAYVVAKPKRDLHSPYYQFLLRTPPFIEQMRQGSKGIADFRLRLYWEQFRLIMLPVPPLDEQKRIAVEAQREISHAIEVTGKVRDSVDRLKERRSTLITAAINGQIDVPAKARAFTAKADRTRFRLIVGAEIVHRYAGNPKFGRVKLQKALYLAEAHVGISELRGNYMRRPAGPHDHVLIDDVEREMEAEGFYCKHQPNGPGGPVTYRPLSRAGQHAADLGELLGLRADTLRSLIALLSDLDRRQVEAVATIYAVWNDELIDGRQADDNSICKGVLTEWDAEKGEKFKDRDLRHWLGWMKRNGLVPRGHGPHTVHTMTRDMFPC